jgi:hypothetical protein
MVEPPRALAEAVAECGRQVGAQYHGARGSTRTAIRAALRPIDDHRARYARGSEKQERKSAGSRCHL